MKPEDYPSLWDGGGKGLGLQAPGEVELPDPARGTVENQAIEPDTGGMPPQAVGAAPGNSNGATPPPDTVTIQAVTVSGGSTTTEELNVVIVP